MAADAVGGSAREPQPVWALNLLRAWRWVQRSVIARRTRRLRVCETLSLGERRFLAVIEFDHQEFLVGGGGNSLEVLARIEQGKVVTEPSNLRK